MSDFVLEVYEGVGDVRQVPLEENGSITIGRIKTCDVVVNGPGVSRVHCELFLEGGEVRLANKSSTKAGTTVNGRSVDVVATLEAGDEITVGDRVLVLRGEEPPESEQGEDTNDVEDAEDVEDVDDDDEVVREPARPARAASRQRTRGATPRRRRYEYPPVVENARAGALIAAFVMFVVGLGLAHDAWGPRETTRSRPLRGLRVKAAKGPQGAGGKLARSFVRWAKEKRDGSFGLRPQHVVGVLVSLHMLTAGFLAVLTALGGREAFRSMIRVATPLVAGWGLATILALLAGGEILLASGFLIAYGVPAGALAAGMLATLEPPDEQVAATEDDLEPV